MLLSLVIALIGPAVQDSAEARLAARVAGCYALVPGPWQTDTALARFFPVAQAPTRFRLAAEPLPGWAPPPGAGPRFFQVAAEAAPGMPPRTAGLFTAWWRHPESDTVRVSYPLPLAGVSLDLAPVGPDLAGRITSFTDAIPPDGVSEVSRPVRARRVPCGVATPADAPGAA